MATIPHSDRLNSVKLRELLAERDMTQTALAEGAGISKAELSLVLNNKRRISVCAFKRICNFLNIDPKEIW